MKALSKVNYSDDLEDDSTLLISKEDFIRRINIQRKTFDKYIKEQKIVPDRWITEDSSTPRPYFTQETFDKYVNQFKWTVITPDNIKEVFMERIEQMDMQRSYKPLLLKTVIEKSSDTGKLSMKEVVSSFRDFYSSRKNNNQFVENDDSIFTRSNYTDEEAKKEILRYPLDCFAQMNIVEYVEYRDEVVINPTLWESLTVQDKQQVISICEATLNYYYDVLLAT